MTGFAFLLEKSRLPRTAIKRMKLSSLILLISVAVLLRIALALHPGLWSDEIFSLAMATGHSLEHPAVEANPALGDYVESPDPQPAAAFRRYTQHDASPAGPSRVIRAVLLSDTSPPLYYLLLNAWTRMLGTSDAALRLFSTLWAVGCFPLLWFLGCTLAGRKTAWAACVLFGFSPLALFYSAEGRMYSLLWFEALTVACATLSLARRGPLPYLLAIWILSAASGLLTHYFFAFALAACYVWLVLYATKISRRQIAGLLVATTLVVLPWYIQIPGSMNRWRVTKEWANQSLTLVESVANPFRLAAGYLSVSGPWGGAKRSNVLATIVYAVFLLFGRRQDVRRLFTRRSRLFWFMAAAAVMGPLLFDLLMGTNVSSIRRYALAGLPAAILLVAAGLCRLPRTIYLTALLFIPLIWLPGIQKVFTEASISSTYRDPYRRISIDLSANPQDLIIVHSIPSGVIGVARYITTDTPIASWVVQLERRRFPRDISRFASAYSRIALVKVHDMNEASPAESWLLHHRTLHRRSKLNESDAEIVLF